MTHLKVHDPPGGVPLGFLSVVSKTRAQRDFSLWRVIIFVSCDDVVSYKGAGGLCLTYADCENVETVAYNRSSAGEWTYDSTDVTHIAS